MSLDPVELLWDRDEARARAVRTERENERLRMLLRYAEEAIMAEYRMRTSGSAGDVTDE